MKRVLIGLLTIALFGFGGVLPVAAAGVLTSGTTLQPNQSPALPLKTSVIDSTGKFAYFGTFENPAKVVTVQLKNDAGAWLDTPIVTSNQPNLGNNDYGDPIVVNQFQKSLINSDSDTVYLISSETPARVVRYYTDSSMTPVINTMSEGATVYSGVQHPTAPYLYYGINNGDRWDWDQQIVNGILKANIGLNNNIFLEFPGQGNITAAVIDSTGEFAYFASNQSSDQSGQPGKINKVRLLNNGTILDTPELVSSFNLDAAYDMSGAAVIATGNRVAYFATSEDSGRFSRIVQFNTQTAGRTYMDLPSNAGIVKSLLMAPDGSALYVLTSSRLLQYDITGSGITLNQTATLTLTDTPETAVISPDGAKIYVGFAEGKISEFKVSYTVTYDGNGASGGSTPSNQTKTHDVSLTLRSNDSANPLVRTGYTFSGWNTAADGSGTSYAAGASYTTNAATTLYAQWTVATYNVTYDGNAPNLSSPTPDIQTKTHNTSLTLSSLTPIRSGYTFSGWNTAADGSGTPYAAGASYTANAATTLYAQWTAVYYDIAYYANGGTGATPNAGSKIHDGTIAISGQGGLTRTGYTFSGWNTAADGSGDTHAAGSSYLTNAPIDLPVDPQRIHPLFPEQRRQRINRHHLHV